MESKRKKLIADFKSDKNKNYDGIELSYSYFHFIGGNPKWFCRIWRKNWIDQLRKKSFGQSYGKNKFEAYRKALIDLNTNVYER